MNPRVSVVLSFATLSIALATAIGCSSSDTTTSPTAVKCQVGLALKEPAIGASGGAGAITVTAQPECAWTARSEASWITGVTPASGQGNGEVQFQVAANPTAVARSGSVNLNDVRASVAQAGAECAVSFAPGAHNVVAAGGTGNVSVTAPAGCTWSVTSDSEWLTITSGASGSGSGTIGFTVGANAGAARTGLLNIAGQPFPVSQSAAGAPACQFALQPTAVSIGASGGMSPILVQTTTSCVWSSTSQAGWITFASPTSGAGNGTVTLNIAPNSGGSRVGTVTIAGIPVSVSQAAATGPCQYTIAPTDISMSSVGSTAQVTVQTGSSCSWTSSSQTSWLTFSGISGGTGGGSVNVTVGPHTNAIARSGTVTIAGQTFTVNQSGCPVSIAPAAQTVTAAGGAATSVTVTSASSCSWAASSNDPWITITSGASGTGNGTVAMTVAVNAGIQRVGTITVGGQTHTVTQSAAPTNCSYSINPTSVSVNKNASNNRTVDVTTTANCSWTSESNSPWLTITAGLTGAGNGTVRYDITRNDSGSDRVGTLTIAGRTFTVNQDK